MKDLWMIGFDQTETVSTFEVDTVEGHGLGRLVHWSAFKKSKIFVSVNVTR